MEVRRLLPVELTPDRATVLRGPKSLEAVIDQLGVLFVEVFMGHDIWGAGVHFAAAHLQKQIKNTSRPAAQPRVSVCNNGWKQLTNFKERSDIVCRESRLSVVTKKLVA